jgi:hypothetical protein
VSSDPSNPLSHHHRETIDRIFQHPTSGNIEWRQVRSLLEAIGTVTEEHSGRIVVQFGGDRKTFHVPRDKDIPDEMIRELRVMLADAQLVPPEVDKDR